MSRREPAAATYSTSRDPRLDYSKRPVEQPKSDEYVPSTIDKYMKANMSKDEVLAKLEDDRFNQKRVCFVRFSILLFFIFMSDLDRN